MTNLNDVLLAMSNIPVDDPIAEIWGRGLQGGRYTVIEYTGALPITINANGEPLIDYRIYGNTVQNGTPTPENPIIPIGCGERTENLFDKNNYNLIRANAGSSQSVLYGNPSVAPYAVYIPVTGGETYSFYSQATLSSSCFTIDTPAIGVSIVVNGANSFDSTNVRTAPADAKYLVVFLELNSATQGTIDSNLATLTIVKSPTAPISYIPYGYKLPMVSKTKNLFEVESDMLSSLNWVFNPALFEKNYFINYKLSDAVTQELKKGKHTCSIFRHFTDGYTPNLLVCAFTPTLTNTITEEYRILSNQGVTFDRTFDFSEWPDIYLIIGCGNGFHTEADKQSKIDELFKNWGISIVEGSTAPKSYEPYNSTVANIYLGEVQTTRRIKKLVLTGTEDWTTVTRPTYTYATSIIPFVYNSTAISSHFIQKNFIILANKTFTLFNNKIYIKYNDKTSINDFKQFLAAQYAAGTPVTVWYILTEPEISIVNEPLMKIGDYADTVNTEQADMSIPTSKGTTTLDYDGALKPSQMYIKYLGVKK